MSYTCALCDHPAEDHATGLCLHTLECRCPGYATSVVDVEIPVAVEEAADGSDRNR